jgi:5-methylcytosine-specific restriction protein A
MPTRAARICSHPGCSELAYSGSRCDKHQAEYEQKTKETKAQYNETRPSSSEQGYGQTWQKIRAHYLKRHPLCEKCEGITPAVLVHHIKALKEGGTNDVDNLMALCNACHEKIHGKDRWKRSEISKRNHEHYMDTTAYEAIKAIEGE